MLRLRWGGDENDHIVIECVVEEEVVGTLDIEESGDAVNKVVHITTDSGDRAKVVFHA